MKKLYLIILGALISLTASAQTIGDAFYIYRNDGQFNAFFRDEVDSIHYSCYDLDSTLCDDYVTQVVYTPDSTYRIPLAAIDSVGFVQPETVFQPDVMRMDSTWLPYVIRTSDNSITFSPTTPSERLPKRGQVMVSEVFETPFELGFSGRVSRIDTYADSIVCTVEDVYLSDIYKHIVAVGFSCSEGKENDSISARRRIWAKNTDHGVKFSLPEVTVELGPVTLKSTPTVIMKYIVCLWEENLKDYVRIWIDQTYENRVDINAKFEKDYHPEPIWKLERAVPTNVPGLYGRVMLGGFFRASGSVSLSATKKITHSGVTGFVYSEDKGFQRINKWDKPKDTDWNAAVNLDGSMSTGLAARLQFGIMHEKLASADVTAYLGLELSGNVELNSSGIVEKALYNSIKESEIALSMMAEIVPGYRFARFRNSNVMPDPLEHEELNTSIKLRWPINKWYLVPEFSDLTWKAEPKKASSGTLGGTIKRNLLSKVSLGWVLYDKDDNMYRSEYFPETYRKIGDWRHKGLEKYIENLPYGARYQAYPLVKLMGVEMRADESVEVMSIKTPTISDFKVTKSEHKENGFTNDGKYYDYRFHVATTVEIEDVENVYDWGYVYEDPQGKKAHISLKAHGTSYTDTNYAYYRNEPHSTARLYGYVQYVGDSEYYYGEPHDYSLDYEGGEMCPDANHPHAIDLGLPSGTKWACCNVGASSPEDYGGYYAWGELAEKNVYYWDTYQYYQNRTWVNIGSEISGTQYDVAHVRWGGSYRMPTSAECEELVNNCSYQWTKQNGVAGGLFTGSNGNSVFLPAAGYRWDTVCGQGLWGFYWSGTLSPYYSDDIYVLNFRSGGSYWGNYGPRVSGQSVRPVSK